MNVRPFQLPKVFNARLSRQITRGVFVSIVVIEIVILIPSYWRREQELLFQLEQVSSTTINSLILLNQREMSDPTVWKNRMKYLLNHSRIVLGISWYKSQGQLLESFGEKPDLGKNDLSLNKISDKIQKFHPNKQRYDVAWRNTYLGEEYILVIRHDASSIQPELYAFIARIAFLVIVISAFVTLVTMMILGECVITPILTLRDDLILTAEALSQDEKPNHLSVLSIDRQDELGEVMEAFCLMFDRVYQEISQRKNTENTLREEQTKSEKLLLNILPEVVAIRLKQGEKNIADGFSHVTILFADLVGFTELSTRFCPQDLVKLLNEIFSAFDDLTAKYGLEKIKTIGDNYMVASGLPIPRLDHAQAIAEMALAMQQTMIQFNHQWGESMSIRIGINSGSVIAGVIGKQKFIYDLWGDAVNIASRMESQGIPGTIQVTESTYQLLSDQYLFQERGKIDVKGKGEMLTFLLWGKKT